VRLPTPDALVAVVAAHVSDARVVEAFRVVPRAAFVPSELAAEAYFDEPLPIPHGQVTTQPSLVARMVEALELRGDERVLEIGTGHGFQTAILAHLAAAVWSVERWPDIAAAARENLARQAVRNAEVVVGDGSEGLREHAPYDAIVVSAASPEVPRPLTEQLAPGARLVQPIGPGGHEDVVLFERTDDGLVARRTITGARFVKLFGRHGFEA
jgi:protein-L-isoaspartate(D-aspartate) O-methyltransferase